MRSFLETQQDTWFCLQGVFHEVQVKVQDWVENRDEGLSGHRLDEGAYSLEREDLEAERTYGLGEDVYFAHELTESTDVIHGKLVSQVSRDLAEDFGELSSICGEVNIDVEDEFERIESYLEVLALEEGPLIYVPRQNLLYAPQVLIEVNDEVIRKIAHNPNAIFGISPRKFEEIIAELFLDRGFKVELTKSTRDGGRDIIAVFERMNVTTKYLIECKRYASSNKVSIAAVQRLFGVKIAEAANKAILATTSTFTRDARNFAISHVWDLELKDYNDIMAWIKAYGQ